MTASTKLCVNGRRDVRIKYISIIFLLLLKTIIFLFLWLMVFSNVTSYLLYFIIL